MNPLLALQDYGQSVWLDYMQRHLITSGELQRLIDEDGLRGMTSNPAIFEKAITGSTDYPEALRALTGQNLDAVGLYEQLAIRDIQDAADIFRPVYEQTRRGDGYISLEVSPHLAHDTQGTIREARRLWQTVSRPNLMIKVPADACGAPRHRTADLRRHQRQCHPAVFPGSLRTRRRGLYHRSGAACRRRWRRRWGGQRRQLLY